MGVPGQAWVVIRAAVKPLHRCPIVDYTDEDLDVGLSCGAGWGRSCRGLGGEVLIMANHWEDNCTQGDPNDCVPMFIRDIQLGKWFVLYSISLSQLLEK